LKEKRKGGENRGTIVAADNFRAGERGLKESLKTFSRKGEEKTLTMGAEEGE